MSCTSRRLATAVSFALIVGCATPPPKPSEPVEPPKVETPKPAPPSTPARPAEPASPPIASPSPEARIPGLPTAPPIPEPEPSGAPAPSTKPGARPRSGAKPAPAPKTAQPEPPAVAGLPELLARAERQYAQSGTLVADFAQVITSPNSAKPKHSSGTIEIRYPNQFRWETLKPDPTLVVSDGKTFWQYTPPFDESEPGQVIEGSFAKFRNTLAGSLLAGNFHALVPITETVPAEFALAPKRGTAGSIRRVKFAIDPDKLAMRALTLIHADGTTTVITLSNIALGAKVDPAKFRFVAPKGTDRVRAE